MDSAVQTTEWIPFDSYSPAPRSQEFRVVTTVPMAVEVDSTEELELDLTRLDLIFEKIRRASTLDDLESARRLMRNVESPTIVRAAMWVLRTPQSPERLDIIEDIIVMHSRARDIAARALSETSPVLQIGLCGVLAAHVQAGNASDGTTVDLVLNALSRSCDSEDSGVKTAAVEALERVSSHLPAALGLLEGTN